MADARRKRAWIFWTHVADVVEASGPLHVELASRAMRSDDLGAPLRVPHIDVWLEALSRLRDWPRFHEPNPNEEVGHYSDGWRSPQTAERR